MSIISLAEAIREDRLSEFIEQEESRGVGPADQSAFNEVVKRDATQPRSEDRTSRSRPCGGSNGTKTR